MSEPFEVRHKRYVPAEPYGRSSVSPPAGSPSEEFPMADKSTKTAAPTKGTDNPNPALSTSGLDHQGQMRIGDRITIGVRGGGLVLTQSHSGREVEVDESTLAGLLDNEYFVEHK